MQIALRNAWTKRKTKWTDVPNNMTYYFVVRHSKFDTLCVKCLCKIFTKFAAKFHTQTHTHTTHTTQTHTHHTHTYTHHTHTYTHHTHHTHIHTPHTQSSLSLSRTQKFNTYCFPTSTMVRRKRRSISLHISYCLSCNCALYIVLRCLT